MLKAIHAQEDREAAKSESTRCCCQATRDEATSGREEGGRLGRRDVGIYGLSLANTGARYAAIMRLSD
jgi:hypothetical protein